MIFIATALKGAVVDGRPRQNSDLRRLWVTQIITMIGRAAPPVEPQARLFEDAHC